MRWRRRARVEVEQLGTVTAPSGDLLVIDFGLLRLWSGDDVPVMDPGLASPEVVQRANAAADFEIVGPDAREVARRMDLAAGHVRFVFDVPVAGDLVTDRVAAVCRENGLRATVQRIARMPHQERLERLLADEPDGVEVQFHGLWGVAVRGVPRDRELPVLGMRMDDDAGRWRSVWVEIEPGEPATSHHCGHVLVDEARLLIADPPALRSWRNDESLDGLADLAFWGRDADTLAREWQAEPLAGPGDQFGWRNQPVDRILELGRQLQARQEDLRFALDFRPHDDNHRLLRLMWASATESGTVDLDGRSVTGFFTTWGDGAFPVFRDSTADGRIARLRIELAEV